MRKEILKLLIENNRKKNGIIIPQEVENYVDKLMRLSKIVAVYEGGVFAGFISYYKNDVENKFAFLSMLLVSENIQSKGLGSFLLNTAIEDIKKLSFSVFRLEVLKDNTKALSLYKKFGFKTIAENAVFFTMELKIN